MKVYKFGGASVKDADGIKNLAQILSKEDEAIMVVVSAMGKSTNALEHMLNLRMSHQDWQKEYQSFKKYHQDIGHSLFTEVDQIDAKLEEVFSELFIQLSKEEMGDYDFAYDQVVSMGEILSTTIVDEYLNTLGLDSLWADVRQVILTDSNHRNASVQMEASIQAILKLAQNPHKITIFQGFVAHDGLGNTTTLGREGSDYTAALLAYALDVDEVTIWKDVEGVFNADPKLFEKTSLISELSYREAVELAFYGASIIHPKTIQPLQKKKINLRVRSFYHTDKPGSVVGVVEPKEDQKPSFIIKEKQVLVSLIPRDFSFMNASNMALVFQILGKHQHQVNLIQNSAVSFSVCLDHNPNHFEAMVKELSEHFEMRYNLDQVLVTIRHYKADLMDQIDALSFKMDQRNRSTYQVLLSEKEFENKLLPIIS